MKSRIDLRPVSSRGSYRRCVLFVLAFALMMASALPHRTAVAAPELDYAQGVAYARVPVQDRYSSTIECDFGVPTRAEVALADYLELPSGWMPGSTATDPRTTSGGRLIQIGDYQHVSEQRTEESSAGEYYAFGQSSGWSFGGPGTAHLAVALWGADVRQCTIAVDNQVVPTHFLDGRYAFYAGPESFSGGAFVQDGPVQASAARVFDRELTGGPLFGRFYVNDFAAPRVSEGYVITDDPFVLEPVQECGNKCHFGRPRPTRLTAVLGRGANIHAGSHGQLWVINPPELSGES